MKRAVVIFVLIVSWLRLPCLAAEAPPNSGQLKLQTHSWTNTSKEGEEWLPVEQTLQWNPKHTAIAICDMWNQHWCKGATERVAEMASQMNELIREARRRGLLIIHCPSDTMKYYAGTPQRKLAQSAPKAATSVPPDWGSLEPQREGALPIDDSDGGCDDSPQCKSASPWTHQIDTIKIEDGDAITDSAEAYNLMCQRGITNLIVMGVHGNMCVLGRPFSVRQMVHRGVNVVFVRDMIDTMYNSRMAPFVSHYTGTDLIVEHIEKYWCPSISSTDFLGGTPFHFQADKRPHVVFILGENEYHTWETVPEFAREELVRRNVRCSFVTASTQEGDNQFGNIELIKDADLIFLSVRRRTPSREMMSLIRAHLKAGKPLVGIRTASHAFGAQPTDARHEGWMTFDTDVLGCSYQGHFDASASTHIHSLATSHPVLEGIPTNSIRVTSSLYKSRALVKSATPLMLGEIDGQSGTEPVAWVNEDAGRRVFYTSLGNPDDFKQKIFQRLLVNGIFWSLRQTVPPLHGAKAQAASNTKAGAEIANEAPQKSHGPLSPAESMNHFTVADDLKVEQVLAEPMVRQPVFLNFDERGRMWVVEYLQYPFPAGLKILSHDSVWRVVYDKIPQPPPHHVKGADRITIFEDTNGDGVFDKRITFLDGLNIVTAVTRGRGGVWVLNPPYLLFYSDRNNDDIPDGDPEVHLSGFGIEDTHSVVNSLRWGPDGWLYACQGSTVTANVMRPGIDATPLPRSTGQLIWRYHPETKRYEVFAEGGGNAFGCEIDTRGRVFSGHNGGNTRGFHYQQGAYLAKGFDKHGPLSNPYAFGYFPAMPHPDVDRFTHNFILYDGGALPEKYNGTLFGIEPLQGRVVESKLTTDGCSFKTRDIGYALTSSDDWFRPVDIKVGPDGAVYVADWYDAQVNHFRNHEGQIDKSNGRIYRLSARDTKPIGRFDLSKLNTEELIGQLSHTNKWFRQESLRLLGDRKDKSAIPVLSKIIAANTGQLALESLWALNLCGGLDETHALRTLDHANPFVRLWTARLLCDEGTVAPAISAKLRSMALTEPDVEARAQLASSAKRLPAADGLPIVQGLLYRNEDLLEKRIPLLLWWAIEAKCANDADAVGAMFRDRQIWELPIVQQHILERLMRRFAMSESRRDLATCATLLRLAPGKKQIAQLMSGFELAFKGRSMAALPEELLQAIAETGGESIFMAIRRGDPNSIREALDTISDPKASLDKRVQLVGVLGQTKQASSIPALLALLPGKQEDQLLEAVLTALPQFEDDSIGKAVVARFNEFSDSTRLAAASLLSSRLSWASQLLQSIAAGKIQPKSIPPDTWQKLHAFKDPQIAQLVSKCAGKQHTPTTAEMQKRIEHDAAAIRGGSGDPYEGRNLFKSNCSVCHKLFGQGGQIGPDLTPFKRDDLETMLLSVVNPSAEIREGYENYLLTTKDERTLSGFLVDKDNRVVVLRGIDGINQTLNQDEIQEMKPAGRSLMPEGLLDGFNDQQVRDLFAYLRSSQPLVGEPPKKPSVAGH